MDWTPITVRQFDDLLLEEPSAAAGVSRAIVERLPFVFESKRQYLTWRDTLAQQLEVDGRDLAIVGSAATGRSLNPRKRFKTFDAESDIDIAVVSSHHFDQAWRWFLETDPLIITGLDQVGKEKFAAHRSHYIYEGVIAAEYFLSYLPFGRGWAAALQRNQALLPARAQGRFIRVRIYRDNRALRDAQRLAVETYLRVLRNRRDNQAAATNENLDGSKK